MYTKLKHIVIPLSHDKPFTKYENYYKTPLGPNITFYSPQQLPPRDVKYNWSIVLDMDETLLSAKSGELIIRPYAIEFLKLLKENVPTAEIIVWSSGAYQHVNRAMNLLIDLCNNRFKNLGTKNPIDYIICRSCVWYEEGLNIKDLADLPNRPRCIIIDDNINASIANAHKALIIPPFNPEIPESLNDITLLYVIQIIVRIDKLINSCIKGNKSALSEGIPCELISGIPETCCTTWCNCEESQILMDSVLAGLCEVCSGFHVNIEFFLRDHPFTDLKLDCPNEYIVLDVSNKERVYSRINRFIEINKK